MNSFKKRTLLILLICCKSIFSQLSTSSDSLLLALDKEQNDSIRIQLLDELFNQNLYNEPIKAKIYAREKLNLSKKIGNEKGVARANYQLGVFYYNVDQIDSARIHYLKSKKIYKSIADLNAVATVNHGLAILEYYQGNFDNSLIILENNLDYYSQPPLDSLGIAITETLSASIHITKSNYQIALIHTLKSLKFLSLLGDEIRKADALGMLSAIEFHLDNFQKSIDYNKEALQIYSEHNDKGYSAQALNDIGNSYFYLKDYEQAIHYLQQSIELSTETHSKVLLATTMTNLGKVYLAMDKPDTALSYLNQSLELSRTLGSPIKIVENLNDLGETLTMTKNYKRALNHLDESILLAKESDLNQNLRIAYDRRSTVYVHLNSYKKALEDLNESVIIKDSIYHSNRIKQIEELRTIYETEKKEQQISLQEAEINLLEHKSKINSLQQNLLGSGLVLSFLIIALILFSYQQKNKRRKVEKEKMEAEIHFKNKELTTHALHLAKKNEVLVSLKKQAETIKEAHEPGREVQHLIHTINFDLKDDNNWDNFSRYFEEVHTNFYANAQKKFPLITSNEIRLMALLKMNLSSKEIANILNISNEGVKKARQRLRKKLNLSPKQSLNSFVASL